ERIERFVNTAHIQHVSLRNLEAKKEIIDSSECWKPKLYVPIEAEKGYTRLLLCKPSSPKQCRFTVLVLAHCLPAARELGDAVLRRRRQPLETVAVLGAVSHVLTAEPYTHRTACSANRFRLFECKRRA